MLDNPYNLIQPIIIGMFIQIQRVVFTMPLHLVESHHLVQEQMSHSSKEKKMQGVLMRNYTNLEL